MNKEIIAYTAGIIDGEGCIGVYKDNRNKYYLRISVGNTNSTLIEWLNDIFGGSICCPQHWRKEKNCKPEYRWALSGFEAYKFINGIYPYLIVKRDIAKVGLQFYKITKPNHKLNNKQRLMMDALCCQTKILNKRGI